MSSLVDLAINEARDKLLVLRDIVQNGTDYDMEWQVDQINHALSLVERCRPIEAVERAKYELKGRYEV